MAMNVKRAPQRQIKTASEVRNVSISFADVLDSGELLTGTPTVTEITTSDLTFASETVNTGALTVNGLSVTAGQAIQFRVSGGSANVDYNVQLIAGTDATPAQTLYATLTLGCVGDS